MRRLNAPANFPVNSPPSPPLSPAAPLTAEETLELMSKMPPELFDTLSEEEMRVMARQPDPAQWPADLQVKVSEYMTLDEPEEPDPPCGLETVDL